HISGLHHAAYILVPSSFVLPLLGVHVDFTPDLLARLWSGGICTSTVRTHWVTITNFMGSLPIPSFRVYLGTSSALFGQEPSGPSQDGYPLVRASLTPGAGYPVFPTTEALAASPLLRRNAG